MNMTHKIYKLVADCNDDVVIRTNLEYFRNNFIGLPMHNHWVPPTLRIVGKSKRNRDFISWMLTAPVISERGKEALQLIIAPYVEFLPLIKLKNVQYFALNVTCLIECLDKARSDILYAPNNEIQSIDKYYFIEDKIEQVPIFKVKEWPNDVFVTEPFIDQVHKFNLQGAEFVDPSKDPFDSIF